MILIAILAFASVTCFFLMHYLFTTRFAPYAQPHPHPADALLKLIPPTSDTNTSPTTLTADYTINASHLRMQLYSLNNLIVLFLFLFSVLENQFDTFHLKNLDGSLCLGLKQGLNTVCLSLPAYQHLTSVQGTKNGLPSHGITSSISLQWKITSE